MKVMIAALTLSFLSTGVFAESKIGVSLAKACNRELEDSRVKGTRTTCPAGKDDACMSTATKREPIIYPAAELKAGTVGCVYMMYDIKDGLADNFRIMKLAPDNKAFSQAVLDALMKWEFKKTPVKNQKIVVSFDKQKKPIVHEQKI